MNKPRLLWLNITVFASTTLVALIGVPFYGFFYGFDIWQLLAMLAGIIICEISITAGYHRLWAHKAYQAHWLVRVILAIGGTYAVQNSILHWSSDHRRHHRHVDNDQKDPYSAGRGFWYSHIGWMLRDYQTGQDSNYNNCKDLKKDRIVMWQHNNYMFLVFFINFAIPTLLGLWHGDLIGMLLLAGVLRLVISHHFTFFINSLAHIWGKQPYSDKNTARDNSLLAFLTMGEGYHNYHHCFQRDYRNGIRWYQFDPTKWLISALYGLGLTTNLYRTPVERIEAIRAEMTLKRTAQKLQRLPNADILLLRLQAEYEALLTKINAFAQAKREWIEANRSKGSIMEGYDYEALKKRVEQLKQNFLEQKKNWMMLNARIA